MKLVVYCPGLISNLMMNSFRRLPTPLPVSSIRALDGVLALSLETVS